MTKYLYDGFHKISEVDSVIKGNNVKREKLHLKHAVAGVVIDEYNRIAVVTQYRPTIGRKVKEIPAGVLDKKGLTPLETLLEELEEECGIKEKDLISIKETPILEYYMIIGSSDAKIRLYEIRVKKQQNRYVNDSEVEYVEWLTADELKKYIQEGLAPDPKTILAYYSLKDLLKDDSYVSGK